jgi:hypothetical protein
MRTSPSQVHSYDRCAARWGFKYILGLKEPSTAAQEEGTRGHARVERYLKDGEHPGDDALGKLIQAAMRPNHLPVPRPGLLLEHEFHIPLGGEDSFHGFIDVVEPPDPVGVAVVYDHKFISNLRYAQKPLDLISDPQAIGYGKAALQIFSGANVSAVERRWLYYQKGSTRVLPVTFTQTRDVVEEAWLPLAKKAREMIELRKKKIDPNQLDQDPSACYSYGRACPFMTRCTVKRQKSFTDRSQQSRFLFTQSVETSNDTAQGDNRMSIKDQLAKLKTSVMGSAPAPAPAKQEEQKPEPAPSAPPVAAPPASAPKPGLAALQKLKGASGVNPPERAKAPAPAVETASAEHTGTGGSGVETAIEAQPGKAAAETAPTVTADDAAPAPSKRSRAKKEQAAPSAAARSHLTILFGCAVMKRPDDIVEPVQLIDLLGPIMRDVADSAGKAHWLLIPFNESHALLAHAFDKWLEDSRFKGLVYVDETSKESIAVREVLLKHADFVVRAA